jgi:hypothetical protein
VTVRLRRASAAWLLTVLPMGCSSATQDVNTCLVEADRAAAPYSKLDSGCGCDSPVLAAGSWSGDTFTALTPTTRVALVHGPQGGWHLPVQLLASDMRDLILIGASVTDVATGIVVSSELEIRARLDHKPDCVLGSGEIRVFMDASRHPAGDGSASPNPVSCRDVTLRLKAVDNAERSASFEATFYMAPDPADVSAGLATACPAPIPNQ